MGRNSKRNQGGRSTSDGDTAGVVYGVHPVRRALLMLQESGDARQIRGTQLQVARRGGPIDSILALARDVGIGVVDVERAALDRLTCDGNHQGIAVEMGGFAYVDLADILAAAEEEPHGRVVVLDQIQDPQNLGALLRSAAAFDVTGVVIPKDRAASVTNTVIRVSAGGAFQVRVAQVVNISRTLDALKEAGFWVYGTDAGDDAVDVAEIDWQGAAALVLGAEGTGLRRLTRENCDRIVRIPMTGTLDSLNVSVAGGIMMYVASPMHLG